MIRKAGAVIASLALAFPAPAFSCSAFLTSGRDGRRVGRNFDWDYGHGLLVANPRGLEKTAMIAKPSAPARWRSKYGSLTIDQAGRELPVGGMNEKGLVVEALWLRSARFHGPDARPTVNEMQWVQSLLDRFATVDEVVAHLEEFNVIRRVAAVHYFVCDAAGECAAIEPVDGRWAVHRHVRLLTNDTYDDSAAYAAKVSSAPPAGTKSLDRFARLSAALGRGEPPRDVAGTFRALSTVASPRSDEDDDKTQWQIVYDLSRRRVYLGSAERFVDLARLDFDCGRPAKVLDVRAAGSGELSGLFTDYTTSLNLALASQSTGYTHLSPDTVARVAEYPASAVCRTTPSLGR